MKISLNWLKEFIETDLSAEEIGEILTATGLEVEGLEHVQSIPGGLEGLVVGHVLTAEKHPDADRLRVTTVDVGAEEPLPIVCGAPNVAAGQKVIVALPGTTLYPTAGDSFKIKKSKIRGAVSQGMICAEDEIGLGTDHDGIIVLDADAKVGTPAKEMFELGDDHVYDIGLTPNRSDAMGHLGTARDLYAYLKTNSGFTGELKMPVVPELNATAKMPIEVEVQDFDLCPRYIGVSISGIEVKESPQWLKDRLNILGHRPINNIVDATNYILLETGQPLHAFDADKISNGKVIVKCLEEGAKFETLDNVERKLSAEDLMICDDKGGLCIAGVFGGAESGVTEQTKNVFLECAIFNSVNIRKTSKRHDLRTDAATKYEKGVDPNAGLDIIKRAAKLITELAGGEIASEIVDHYPSPVERPRVTLRYERLNIVTGTVIPKDKVKTIMDGLDIHILKETDTELELAIGTNRADVLREIDVIEEVLRIYGYDNVPIPQEVRSTINSGSGTNNYQVDRKIVSFLSARAYREIMSNSISKKDYYQDDAPLVGLINSLNKNLEILRNSLVFSGLEAIQYNRNRQHPTMRFFELGQVYTAGDEGHKQERKLSVFVTGKKVQGHWSEKDKGFSFFDLKEDMETLLTRLGIAKWQNEFVEQGLLDYGMNYRLGANELLTLGKLSDTQKEPFDIADEVYYAELDLDMVYRLIAKKGVTFSALPKYPSVKRDLALLINKDVQFEQVQKIGLKAGKRLLKNIELFDIYQDKKMGEDKKSYAVSFTLQDNEKTLTDKDVDKLMDKLIKEFESQLGAQLR